ncbi:MULTISPECIES: DUF4032 domain-containing protein [unclassified Nesterenkonia]|uniref:DUF4032 domain-containing protein n=1 Tax=unclassified Nesterenkonia TaxID=2629769 RepID=UPI0008725E78|nr:MULTISPECIES: DUF4032 domain-containing protein [unclassified Nesterenkonia]MDS2172350.1 DUF4032 domain-containing protein [Nesterenkonia sp. CL21]OSM42552.1 lipopolysaccharide kinase [Nesterenkonia sp. PF2B19]
MNPVPGLSLTASGTIPQELLDLPWHLPLVEWPEDVIAALPRGISRHIVRFAHLGGSIIAIKETSERAARHEYRMLRRLGRLGAPCVKPVAEVTGRTREDGTALSPALITRHLRFSLPYRAVFNQMMRKETLHRLIDAQALLMVELHLIGFYWGDVSLSNTLFRRDAGQFAAYLVDAETGEIHPELSTGQREYDLELAQVNIAGELMDLMEGGMVDEEVDPIATSHQFIDSYRGLWSELTGDTAFNPDQQWLIEERIRRLNELGFDVEEYDIRSASADGKLLLRPKVVDPGHHQRRLMNLTGLDVQENQARRLLGAIDAYRAQTDPHGDEAVAAHMWTQQVFQPLIAQIPRELRDKLEPAELMHQLIDHRWKLSEREGRDVDLADALPSFIEEELRGYRDEAVLMINPPTDVIEQLERGERDDEDDDGISFTGEDDAVWAADPE